MERQTKIGIHNSSIIQVKLIYDKKNKLWGRPYKKTSTGSIFCINTKTILRKI